MRRITVAIATCLALMACGGGGGGSSPTEPAPPSPAPPPPVEVSLFGSWQGTMTGARLDSGEAIECHVSWNLQDAGGFPFQIGFGNWNAVCSDGTRGGSVITVTRTFFNIVLVIALPAGPFFGCSWAGDGLLSEDGLSGTWSSEGEECAIPVSGSFELRK